MLHKHMNVLATTRFNTNTWEENKKWREKNKMASGCIYGTPMQINEKILLEATVFVLEMQNDLNKVIGVGLIKNVLVVGKYHNIYSNKDYNRYTYRSNYRIDRENMSRKEERIMKIFDYLLFKTAYHLKRGYGITRVPQRIMDNKHVDFISVFKRMFKKRYTF
jgi:hypothetical protein